MEYILTNIDSYVFGTMPHELKTSVPIYVIKIISTLYYNDTYIFITFLFFQMAVCETSSTFTIRNKLAVKTCIIHLTL
jgi:hypothetical protein